MHVQSFVIGSGEIELSLGDNDGGREYVFARLPLPDEDLLRRSLNDVQLATLRRVRDAISKQIEHLQESIDVAL